MKVLGIGDIEAITFRTQKELTELSSYCSRLAAIARKLNCPALVVSGSVRPRGADAPKVRAELISSLAKLLDAVEPEEVGLALAFKGFSWCDVNSLEQVAEAVANHHSRRLGFALDTFDLHAARISPQALCSVDPEKIFIFRLSDCDDIPAPLLTDIGRLFPGEGKADMRAMLESITCTGFSGPVSLRALSPRLLDMDAREIATSAFAAIEPYLQIACPETGIKK